jgi:3-hydroxyacyl-CoA dehydrogenase/enoyl-CoA hydratase/3-hydroxybutyryl-CoA epimerase/3-hydroxyacyl-CoA dehydrogenase/enoyl-CoA hydratase/3-hydroxybutyryl-CoA epimerase/enoyl-CoA isomerase
MRSTSTPWTEAGGSFLVGSIAPAPATAAERALENVRLLAERSRRDPAWDGAPGGTRNLQSLGIVGAGMMGIAIAAAHLKYRLPVVLADSNADALSTVRQRLIAELAADMPAGDATRLVDWLVRSGSDDAALASCDLLVEAIAENPTAKQNLLARLEGLLDRDTLWASNTSTIPIARLASRLNAAGRFCGLHFCHPVRSRPLVEIVRGPQTSPQTIATLVAHVRSLDRLPLVVADGPGFVVNRLLLAYLGEALDLLLEGATVEAIEQAAIDFGMAMGPLQMIDEIGLDVVLSAGWLLAESLGDRVVASPLLPSMVKAGRLGCKSGEGFFVYPTGASGQPQPGVAPKNISPALARLVTEWARPPLVHNRRSIRARLLLPMLLEATRILEEGRVRDAGDIDLAMLFGLGFPHSTGGLLWWADTLGAARIVQMLRSLEGIGPRAKPTPLLLEMARSGRFFYGSAER